MKLTLSSVLEPSSFLCLFILFATLARSCYAQCNVQAPAGDVIVCAAADPRIQFNPPMNNGSSVWEPISPKRTKAQGLSTADVEAEVSLTFQGTSLKFYAITTSDYPPLLVTLDGSDITPPSLSDQRLTVRETSLGGPVVDSTINHTVVIRKSPGASTDASWNIVAFSFTRSRVGPPLSIVPVSHSDETSTMGPSSAAVSDTDPPNSPRKLTGGAISGIVIGILIGVGLAGALFVCLRRRRTSEIPPEPLIISPVDTRPNRSRFRRLNSVRLPHFTAPPSIWPSSTGLASRGEARPMSAARGPIQPSITPYTLPAIPPKLVVPSPPRRPKPQKPRASRFVITNPSSLSSRSIGSLSLRGNRRPELMPAKDNSVDLLTSGDPAPLGNVEEEIAVEPRPTRLDKGKQRAVDSGSGRTDPVPPRRTAMARQRSLHRFFFTTNPSPSTSSGSSTTVSQGRSASMRKASAVAEYVRDQMRRRPSRRRHPGSKTPPMSTAMRAPVSIPGHTPSSVLLPVPEAVPSRQAPRQSRTSQVRFFTTNPSPSVGDGASERGETESSLSEIPPPRKDKGKARAF